MIRYVIYVGGEKSQEGELTAGEHIVGRSRSADIHIPEKDVSGRHLKLEAAPDGLWVENLSSHGTLLSGRPLDGRQQVGGEVTLVLSKSTELRLIVPEAPAPGRSDGAATVIPGGSSDGAATVIPGASAPAEDRDRTVLPGVGQPAPGAPEPEPEPPKPAEGDVGKTDVMHTRLASLEELNLLRSTDRRRSAGKLLRWILGGAVAVAALTLLYSLRSEEKEPNLSWPVDSSGRALGAFADPGNGGHTAGGFSLAYPNVRGTTVEKTPGRIVVNTRFGRDASVPLRIIFLERQSEDFLTMERRAVFARLLAEVQKDDRRWSLAQISDVFFIGSENGMPCLSCEYRREVDKESWYGEMLFFRTGDRAYLRLAETPTAERARGQNFISNTPLVKFSPDYLHGHWEGDPDYRGGANVDVMLDEVSRHLSKQAPFEWARTYLLLQRTLMECTRSRDDVHGGAAVSQLRRLRNMQTIWYNSQRLQFNTARLNGDRRQENAILELCKTVFSSPDDLRYFTLRRNVWE